jgi:hypothetical protein
MMVAYGPGVGAGRLLVVTNVQPLLVASYTFFCSTLILPIFHGVDSPIKSPLLLDVASIFCFLKL